MPPRRPDAKEKNPPGAWCASPAELCVEDIHGAGSRRTRWAHRVIALERAIRFEEVDAAGIVFFAHFLSYAHDAMEHFFRGLEGGYSRLIVERKIGLPAVKVAMSFASPVRYGERLRVETTTKHLGTRSATLRYRMIRASDGELSAEVEHTVVTTDLTRLRSCPMPDDVRAILAAHLAAP